MGPSSFLLEILQRLEHRDANNQTSEFLVWSTIIERLSRLSKDDDSMWQHVQRAFDLLWIAHPDCHPGRKLLRIGIEASKATSNGRLASQVIFNEVATFAPSPFASAGPTDIGTEESVIEDRESLDEAATKSLNVHKTGLGGSPIAYGILRTGLEVCMASGDIESASLILHSFEKVSSLFPLAKQTELYGLALMVYAQVGDSEASKSLLQAMKSRGMKPR